MKRKIVLLVLLAAATIAFSTNTANAHPWRYGWGRVGRPHIQVMVPLPAPPPPAVMYRNNYYGRGYCRPNYGQRRYYNNYYNDRNCGHGRGYGRYYR